ncbi:hypothetical protein GTW44_10295 [Streptomyces sp. SID8360]|nr:hypothetical protein [Streptomyces sp. SID4940]MYT61734.1 hypothetical protein [Streptomyces sp. SID8357]MYT85103.1 hypothetical protein [Streptomyces sp. SID8360]MYW39201.1 hypothetical protein [Streptomyces sp. SID1]
MPCRGPSPVPLPETSAEEGLGPGHRLGVGPYVTGAGAVAQQRPAPPHAQTGRGIAPEAQQYVKKYPVSHPVSAESYPSPAYDGLTEIWFESCADHDAFFASKNYEELVNPDESTVMHSVAVMVTEERVVLSGRRGAPGPPRPRPPRSTG